MSILPNWIQRLRYSELAERHPGRALPAIFALVNGAFSLALMGGIAVLADLPMIFPSLGPTAFLFFDAPLSDAASPRSTVTGHAIGAVAGWLSLAVFGLLSTPSVLIAGVSWAYGGAAAMALGLTAGLMILLDVRHPPAGATTLIVALGLMTDIGHLVVLMVAVCLLTAQAFAINRLAGLPYPRWRARAAREPS